MTSSNYATNQTFDDIVFEGRNREYGAYLLRKIYTQNLFRGLATAIALFLLFLSLPLILNKLFPKEFIIPPTLPIDKPLDFVEVVIPDIPEPPAASTPAEVKPQEPAPSTGPTEQLITPVVSTTTTTTMPEVNLPPGITPGTTTSDGTGSTAIIPNTGTSTGTGILEVPVPEKIFDFVEQQPEFPGGTEAMMKYVSQNIRYPDVTKRNGLEGLVVLSFVVDQDGGISEIKVLKPLGGGTEEEAIRVVKSMPKWTPGKQNGRAVKVRFTFPFRFAIK